MKATLSNYRQSPQKTRLVVRLVHGKSVGEALEALSFLNKKAAEPVAKLIKSAAANAADKGEKGELFIKNITVDKGVVYKRFMPRARGSASPINKRNSHITVELGAKS